MRLTSGVALAMLCACSKSESPRAEPVKGVGAAKPTATPASPASPAPTFATPEAKLRRYQDCLASFNAGADSYAACFAKDAQREQVDSVPESIVKGAAKIGDTAKAQHASYPDLFATPQLIIASGSDVIAILYVRGTNTGNVEELAATGKKIAVFEAEIVTIGDDGLISSDRVFVDQPTIYHQLGLVPNDTSPEVTARKPRPVEALVAKTDATEAANKALIEANLSAINKKDTKSVVASAALDVSLIYHGDKQRVTNKKAFQAWVEESVRSSNDGNVAITHTWTAGEYVVVSDTFTGTPTEAVAGKGPAKKIESRVLEFFRVKNGKLAEQQIFGNRLKVALQLGLIDPVELADTLSKHK